MSGIEVDGDAATVTLESGTTLELALVRSARLVTSPPRRLAPGTDSGPEAPAALAARLDGPGRPT